MDEDSVVEVVIEVLVTSRPKGVVVNGVASRLEEVFGSGLLVDVRLVVELVVVVVTVVVERTDVGD